MLASLMGQAYQDKQSQIESSFQSNTMNDRISESGQNQYTE